MARLHKFIVLASGILILFIGSSCTKKECYVKTEGMIWNTLYHITFQGPENLRDSILPVLNEVGQSLSVFDKNSLVSKLNISDSLEVDKHFVRVYDESFKIYNLSQRRFDPTVGPLIDIWGFGLGHTPDADTVSVDSVRVFVGLDKTQRIGNVISKNDKRTRFNFSAIAKGYGVDAVGEMFSRNGVDNYMVEIGGEVALKGKSPSGNQWKIAVDAPQEGKNPGEETAIILSLTDVGLATSGNYRNFRVDGGQKTPHTISPVSGRPFISEILSATVIASTCMEADALATACMAGTFEEAKALFSTLSQENVAAEGLLITADSLWMSEGFKQFILEDGEPGYKARN